MIDFSIYPAASIGNLMTKGGKSCAPSLIRLFAYSLIRLFAYSLIRLFAYSLIRLFASGAVALN
ncbi:hypothetical protein CF033_20905 [Klebsiella michiganensis]|nr:hypothetical protein [Klebsiella michiganensis]